MNDQLIPRLPSFRPPFADREPRSGHSRSWAILIRRGGFLGLGLSVPKAEDLEQLSRAFGARIEQADGPGGGAAAHLRAPKAPRLTCSTASSRVRRCRFARPFRMTHQTGSYASTTLSGRSSNLRSHQARAPCIGGGGFRCRVRWYIDTLGFRPSDVMCLPDGTPVGAFMRLDHGKEPTDHHTLFLATGLEPKDL